MRDGAGGRMIDENYSAESGAARERLRGQYRIGTRAPDTTTRSTTEMMVKAKLNALSL